MANPFVNSEHDEQQDARKERLLDRADRKVKQSNDAYKRSHELVEHIPFGQPILVGHHSERRHRNTLDRSWNLMGKSVHLSNEADSLKHRAAGVGTGGISSTEPGAIEKLEAELDNLVQSQNIMKAVNLSIRQKNTAMLVRLGLNDEKIRFLTTPDKSGNLGFASYQLQNNNANIRRIKQRIKQLTALRYSEPLEHECDDFSMTTANGQFQFYFSGIPNEETRTLLKNNAFKWSRFKKAWVRKTTLNAYHDARRVLACLEAYETIY